MRGITRSKRIIVSTDVAFGLKISNHFKTMAKNRNPGPLISKHYLLKANNERFDSLSEKNTLQTDDVCIIAKLWSK